MRLGIDFGTTHTVVAAADRGNYPVIEFVHDSGDATAWYPSLIACREGEVVFGREALACRGDPRTEFVRSAKRLLAESGPSSTVRLGGAEHVVFDLAVRLLAALKRDLQKNSTLEIDAKETLEALVAVPANANSNQRFMTLDAFRAAGFKVLGLLNEPSAAGIEYAHRYARRKATDATEYVVVYDLGGGTFDSAAIEMSGRSHEILTSEGIARLGGDDFDGLLTRLILAAGERGPDDFATLDPTARFHLLEEAREQKERLHANTRRIVVDLNPFFPGAGEVTVATDAYYAACGELIERTIAAVAAVVERLPPGDGLTRPPAETASIYVVGGGSELPAIARALRERWGRRVKKSPHPFAATAMGLAIAAGGEAGYSLRERFTRHFGVWREADGGRRIVFDPIFTKDTPLPAAGELPLEKTRSYHPAHNVGHFRYAECGHLDAGGAMAGDVTVWDQIYFPFDPELKGLKRLDRTAVERRGDFEAQLITETYHCDSNGIIEVTIANESAGYSRKFRLRD